MKAIKSFLALIFLLAVSNAEAQHQPDQLSIGPPFILPHDDLTSTTLPNTDSIAEMPVIDFPEEAKILVWGPDSSIDFNMPNALSPDLSVLNNVMPQKGKGNKKENNGSR